MELEMSLKKGMANWGRRKLASVVLCVLYGGIYQLYQTDARVQREIDRWPEGMTYGLKCSPQGPSLYFRKNEGKLMRLNPRIQKKYDTCITFKSLETAFLVLTGRMGIAGAYAAHGFSLHGDIGTAMELVRCVDLVESHLFPRVMTKRILKEVEPKGISSIHLYLRIFAGLFRGAYAMARGEKKTYRQMRTESLRSRALEEIREEKIENETA